MASTNNFFKFAQFASEVDPNDIFLGELIACKAQNASNVSFNKVPIFTKWASKGSLLTSNPLFIELNAPAMFLHNKNEKNETINISLRIKLCAGKFFTQEELAVVEKMEKITEKIREAAKKMDLKKLNRTGPVDVTDFTIFKTQISSDFSKQSENKPSIFAKPFCKADEPGAPLKICLGEKFCRILTKKEQQANPNRKPTIQVDPEIYAGKWMNIRAVIKIDNLFIGSVNCIQIRLTTAIVLNVIEKVLEVDEAAVRQIIQNQSSDDEEDIKKEMTEEDDD
jgi:hypothetical protein